MTHPLQSRIHNRWNCLLGVWQDWSCDQSVVGRRGRLGPSQGKDWLLMKAEEGVSLCLVVCVPTSKPTRLQRLVPHLWSCGWLWINSESQSKTKHMSGRRRLLGGEGLTGVGDRWAKMNWEVSECIIREMKLSDNKFNLEKAPGEQTPKMRATDPLALIKCARCSVYGFLCISQNFCLDKGVPLSLGGNMLPPVGQWNGALPS